MNGIEAAQSCPPAASASVRLRDHAFNRPASALRSTAVSLSGGAVKCLACPLRLPHFVQHRFMRRHYAPQRGFPFVARRGDALVHFIDPRRHLFG